MMNPRKHKRIAYGKGRIVLTRRRKPLAAVIPFGDNETLESLEDAADVRLALKRLKESGGKSLAQVNKEQGL